MRQKYIDKEFRAVTIELVDVMNRIIDEYQAQGFVLTVRQLYYQLVARDIIPNTLQEYKRAAAIINDAKLAGLIDWDAIEDRTRDFIEQTRWRDGAHILRAARDSFHMDMWEGQYYRAFAIVEKEALVGVLEGVCKDFDMPLLAARGYPSGSVLRAFAEDSILPALEGNQEIVILHLGDHDPSGVDMTRDLEDRISLFVGDRVDVRRIALNMRQIEEEKPPENPAKVTDSRFAGYAARYGVSSWELDALSPTYLANLVKQHTSALIHNELWEARRVQIEDIKRRIEEAASHFQGA